MKELTQDVFEGKDPKWTFAAVDCLGALHLFDACPKFANGYWYSRPKGESLFVCHQAIKDPENSAIERDGSTWKPAPKTSPSPVKYKIKDLEDMSRAKLILLILKLLEDAA